MWKGDMGCTWHISVSTFEEHQVPHTKMLYQVLSPHLHFIFHGQLSQHHWYLAPPEAMTAFNWEQWLREHMLWSLEETGVPPKANKQLQDIKAGRCRRVHPNRKGTWLPQPPPCLRFPKQLHQQELQCSLMKLDIWHPEGPTLPNTKECKFPGSAHYFCGEYFYYGYRKLPRSKISGSWEEEPDLWGTNKNQKSCNRIAKTEEADPLRAGLNLTLQL